MLKFSAFLLTVYLGTVFYCQCSKSTSQPLAETENVDAKSANEACYKECLEDVFICTAYIEDFSSTPYFCGMRWTYGYGSTIDLKGERVTEHTPPITKEQGKETVYMHLEKHVRPFLKYVERPLQREEMITTCLFIYNTGGTNFSGYNEKGEKVGNPSQFLCALNNREDAASCARKLTGFRSSNGKQAKGLLKRRWVEAAIFLRVITPNDLLDLQPANFYNADVDFYYENTRPDADNYYTYDFSDEIREKFLEENSNLPTCVRDII